MKKKRYIKPVVSVMEMETTAILAQILYRTPHQAAPLLPGA